MYIKISNTFYVLWTLALGQLDDKTGNEKEGTTHKTVATITLSADNRKVYIIHAENQTPKERASFFVRQ